MSTVKPDGLLEQLKWRYAVKKFDSAKKIGAAEWKALEEALVLAPSSFGLQPWKFVVVTDPKVRKQLRAVSWDQSQIEEASHLVVFAAKKTVTTSDVDRLIKRIVDVRKVPADALSGYRDMMNSFVNTPRPGFDIGAWAGRQTYVALGVFLTSAAAIGIDACPMEGLDGSKYDEILGLSAAGYQTLCVATAGYRASDDSYAGYGKVRFPASEVIQRI